MKLKYLSLSKIFIFLYFLYRFNLIPVNCELIVTGCKSFQLGKHDVQNNQRWSRFGPNLQCTITGPGPGHPVTRRLQNEAFKAGDPVIILDDKNHAAVGG